MRRIAAFTLASALATGAAFAQTQPPPGPATCPCGEMARGTGDHGNCPCAHAPGQGAQGTGMMGAGMPCREIRTQGEVTVEETTNGANLKITAKPGTDPEQVRAAARQLAACMGGTPAPAK